MNELSHAYSWLESIKAFKHPRVVTMLFLGISAGLPLLLIFSSLSLWLREAGVEKAAVTYFSWAALSYSFKFVWAPLVDKLPLPFLTKALGRRRAWLLLSQLMIMSAIVLMAFINPAEETLTAMALAAVLLGFSSATQDVVIDAYRIESADNDLQALMSSTYIAGYRVGMLIAGAGALFLASYFGSTMDNYNYSAWKWSYLIMAAMMSIGIVTTVIITEPIKQSVDEMINNKDDYLGFLFLFTLSISGFVACFAFSAELISPVKSYLSNLFSNNYLASFLVECLRLSLALIVAAAIAKIVITSGVIKQQLVEATYIEPVKDFFHRYGWSLAWLLLALIGLYRISDIVLGVISNVFYQDLGFTKVEIASVVKSFWFIDDNYRWFFRWSTCGTFWRDADPIFRSFIISPN